MRPKHSAGQRTKEKQRTSAPEMSERRSEKRICMPAPRLPGNSAAVRFRGPSAFPQKTIDNSPGA